MLGKDRKDHLVIFLSKQKHRPQGCFADGAIEWRKFLARLGSLLDFVQACDASGASDHSDVIATAEAAATEIGSPSWATTSIVGAIPRIRFGIFVKHSNRRKVCFGCSMWCPKVFP